jgi:hypothetical protein
LPLPPTILACFGFRFVLAPTSFLRRLCVAFGAAFAAPIFALPPTVLACFGLRFRVEACVGFASLLRRFWRCLLEFDHVKAHALSLPGVRAPDVRAPVASIKLFEFDLAHR